MLNKYIIGDLYIKAGHNRDSFCSGEWMQNKEIGNQFLLWANTESTDIARLDGSNGNWLDYESDNLLVGTTCKRVFRAARFSRQMKHLHGN